CRLASKAFFSDWNVKIARATKEVGMSKLSSWKTILFLCVLCAATAIASSAETDCSVSAPCFKAVVSFNGTDGANPAYGPLVQGLDGNFYGTTAIGGTSTICSGGCGTVFKITAGGKLTTLHSFDGSDGEYPYGG